MKKVAILTGSSGQLGQCLIKKLVENDFYVYGLDFSASPKEIESLSIQKVDITDVNAVASFFEELQKSGVTVDCLINNAGVGVFSSFKQRTKAEFMRVLEVNLFGTFNMIQHSLNLLTKDRLANIINIGSIYGVVSSDPAIYDDLDRMNSEVYSASKSGIIQLTKYFSVHLSKNNVSVNTVSPGGIFNAHPQGFIGNYSKKCPLGRMGDVSEMADAIMLFVNNTNAYLTGQNLIVDGGFTAW